jgi:hypothetical protein
MRPTIARMSALSEAALRGDVAPTAGGAGAAARRAGLRVGFFVAFFLLEELCFFFVVWGAESIGATASAAINTTAKALSLRYIESTEDKGSRLYHARVTETQGKQHLHA